MRLSSDSVTPFRVGDRVVPDDTATQSRCIREHGKRDYYIITSISDVWIRVEGENSGKSHICYKKYKGCGMIMGDHFEKELFEL